MDGVSDTRQQMAREAWQLRSEVEAGDQTKADQLAEIESRLDGRAYRLPTDELSELQAAMKKAVRSATRLGCPPPLLQVTDQDLMECVVASSGVRQARRVSTVVLTGTEVRPAEGWRYVATIQHPNSSSGHMRPLPGCGDIDLSAYEDAGADCEHCGLRRRRLTSYLVEGPDGQIRQVGSGCLKDYIEDGNPEEAARYAESLLNITDLLNKSDQGLTGWLKGSGRGGGSDPRQSGFFDAEQYLSWVAQAIRASGWHSRREAYERGTTASADQARSALLGALSGSHNSIPNAADQATAHQVVDWARKRYAGDRTRLSSYERDVADTLDQPLAAYRSLPLLAALIPIYDRAQARAAAGVNSGYQGQIGERLETKVKVDSVRERETDFGMQRIYQLQDKAGNIFTWFSTSSSEMEVGKEYDLRGTVKRHEEYEGVQRTILTRCNVLP